MIILPPILDHNSPHCYWRRDLRDDPPTAFESMVRVPSRGAAKAAVVYTGAVVVSAVLAIIYGLFW